MLQCLIQKICQINLTVYKRLKANIAATEYFQSLEAAIQRCSCKNVFWKYAANLQENTHAEV